MDFWDDFEEKTGLSNGLYWTAKYHSYNQRYNDIFYVITLYRSENNDFAP